MSLIRSKLGKPDLKNLDLRKLGTLAALVLLCVGNGAFYALWPKPGGERELVSLIGSCVLGLLFILLLCLSFRRGTEADEGRWSLDRVFFTLTGIDAYVFLTPLLGYYCSSWVFLVLFALLSRATSLLKALAVATVVAVGLWLVFDLALGAPMPRGLLF